MAQIWTMDLMTKYCREAKASGLTVVLTNGCFDTFHAGHLQTLRFAKKQGDVLIVAVNTDESIRTLKGPHRPVYPLKDRMAILAELACVDYVVSFGTAENPSVEPLIEQLRPDVLVKGGDYTHSTVVGGAVVEHHGGRVVIGPVVPGLSSTKTIEKLATEGTEDRPAPAGSNGSIPVDLSLQTSVSSSSRTSRSKVASAVSHSSHPWLFVDMDGVLADPFTPMARLLKLDLSPEHLQGRYDLGQVFGLPDDYFAMFGPQFWESAPWMLDGQAIWQMVLSLWPHDRILLCSSPTREYSSTVGKLNWIERHLPEEWHRRYSLTPVKEAMDKNAILLDDCDDNVNAFRAAGGRAILVPRAWNSLWGFHGSVPDDIEYALQTFTRDRTPLTGLTQ